MGRRIYPGDYPVIEDGVYVDISNNAYHEDPAISKSGLATLFDLSPYHYAAPRVMGLDKSSDAMTLGTLVDIIVLTPGDDEELISIPPTEVLAKNGARSGNKYKAWAAEQCDKIIPSRDMWDTARRMRDSLLEDPEHEEARLLLTSGVSQVSAIVTDQERGIRVKVRPDHIPGADIITDLKTARSAHPRIFGYDAWKFKYHWSGYMMLHYCTEATGRYYSDFRLVVVENVPPFDVSVFSIEKHILLMAKEEVEMALDTYAECFKLKIWPGYHPKTQPIRFPRKAFQIFEGRNSYE